MEDGTKGNFIEAEPEIARGGVGAWVELLCLALILTFAAHALPDWVWWNVFPDGVLRWLQRRELSAWGYDGLVLLFAMVLALPTPRRSGVCVGKFLEHWWKVVGVMAVPVVLTAAVYPWLGTRPFAGMSASMWVVSPLAQDVIFAGYLYGRFERLAGKWVHPRVPINGALLITAIYFVLWHVPNFGSMPAGYVVFQLCYVFVGTVWMGMTRVWTGSIFYITVVHVVVNWIAWWAS